MKKLSQDKVQHIFRNSEPYEVEIFVDSFNKYSNVFGFHSDFLVNAFLAQINEEVGTTLAPKLENLNYSCKALKALFGYYKRNPAHAKRDGRCKGHRADQRAIANHAYAGRLGNINHNDGWMFRGAGYIQLTGRGNYEDISTVLSLSLGDGVLYTPEDLSHGMTSIEGALLSAMAFFFRHKLYEVETIDQMTALVNKHTHSYEARKKHYQYIATL